jgi:D-alanyl-D-alanine carboxypeptidase
LIAIRVLRFVIATSTTATLPPHPPTRGYGLGLRVLGPESFAHTVTLESTHAMTALQADGITWAIALSGDFSSSTRDLAGIIGEAMRLADIT